jgi:hypothetical protein
MRRATVSISTLVATFVASFAATLGSFAFAESVSTADVRGRLCETFERVSSEDRNPDVPRYSLVLVTNSQQALFASLTDGTNATITRLDAGKFSLQPQTFFFDFYLNTSYSDVTLKIPFAKYIDFQRGELKIFDESFAVKCYLR